MRELRLTKEQLKEINKLLHGDKGIDYSDIEGFASDLSSDEINRVLSFSRKLKADHSELSFDCVDGVLVGRNADGVVAESEGIKEYLLKGNDGLANNPDGVEGSAENVAESKLVVKDPEADLFPSVVSTEVAVDDVIEGDYNTVNDPRYGIKSVSSIAAASTAEKSLKNGGMIRLSQDMNLDYVAQTLKTAGSSFPLQAHCNGENLDLTIVGVDSDHNEDYMVYLPGEEGVSSEIITIDPNKCLAINKSGEIFLLNKDPEWDFSVNNGVNYDRVKDFSKGVTETQLLNGMAVGNEKDDSEKDNRRAGGGIGFGGISNLSPKKLAHSLAGAMNGVDPASLPGYMSIQASRALEALDVIKEAGFSPSLKSNADVMRNLNDAMENMAVSAQRMQDSGIDFSKDANFKDFVSKYTEMTNSMREASANLKDGGSDLLHQGKEILNSFDAGKLKEMASNIANAISSALGR